MREREGVIQIYVRNQAIVSSSLGDPGNSRRRLEFISFAVSYEEDD